MSTIAVRLAEVHERIDAAARAAHRDPRAIRLVAVSKEMPATAVADAFAAGHTEFGENRAQELLAKAVAVRDVVWHFVGRVQRNKVKALVPHVAWWHSVDRAALADELGRQSAGARVLVQVNVGGEDTKAGCAPSETAALVEHARRVGLDVVGLMTVPPPGDDPRPHFARLRALADSCDVQELSMGMTGDFEAAISEGATIVRVGTAIFGPRS
jgi:pyridoxal phosphate enzyme (YggS family)